METTLPLQSEESARSPASPHSLLEEPTSDSTPSPPPASPHSLLEETTSDSTPSPRREYDMVKLFEAVAKFRRRNGILPTRSAIIPDFLNEVKDFVPLGLSTRGLIDKLYRERKNFMQKPSPPDCPDSDRYLYELQLEAFEPPSLCRTIKRNARGSVKPDRAADVTKKRPNVAKKAKGFQNDSGSSPT